MIDKFKHVLLGVTTLLFGTTQAYGIGLAEIDLKSKFNQPFNATITITVVDPVELKYLNVGLANKSAYEMFDVQPTEFLRNISFKMIAIKNEKVVIALTTEATVREPFLDFIIEANGTTGRFLKKYTLLFDPPSYNTERIVTSTVAHESDLGSIGVEIPRNISCINPKSCSLHVASLR